MNDQTGFLSAKGIWTWKEIVKREDYSSLFFSREMNQASTLIKFFTPFFDFDTERLSVDMCRELLRCSMPFSQRLKWLTPSSPLPLKSASSPLSSSSYSSATLYCQTQLLAGAFAHCTLGCKALHVKGEGETNKSALVLQKQAHRCMPCEKICTVRFDSSNSHPARRISPQPKPCKKDKLLLQPAGGWRG